MAFTPFPWKNKGEPGPTKLNRQNLNAAEEAFATAIGNGEIVLPATVMNTNTGTAQDLFVASGSGSGASRVALGVTGEQLQVNSDGTLKYIPAPEVYLKAWKPAGNGTTDDSAKALEAVEAAGQYGRVRLGSGTFKIALGTLGKEKAGEGRAIQLVGDGAHNTTLVPVNAEEPLFIQTGPTDASNKGLYLSDLCIENTAHRRYDKPLIELKFARNYSVQRVRFEGGNFTGTFFHHESAYEGTWQDIWADGWKYAVPFLHTNEVAPEGGVLQQCDNFVFNRCTFNGPVGPVFRKAEDEVHAVIALSLKVVASNFYPKGTELLTELSKAVTAGATTCELESVTGLEVGHLLRVGHDANGNSSDLLRVTGITGKEVAFAATTPFLFSHAIKASVQNGGVGLTLGDNIHSSVVIQPHFERLMAGIAVGNVTGLKVISYYGSSNFPILICGPSAQHLSVYGVDSAGGPLANELWKRSSDNPNTNLADYASRGPFTTQTGKDGPGEKSITLAVLPPASTTYTAEYEDTSKTVVLRKNVASTGSQKDRAYETSINNATTFKVQMSGRGQFVDSITIGDLGELGTKTSAEIDIVVEAKGVSPTDATQSSATTLLGVGTYNSKRVWLTRQIGAGKKWEQVAMTEIA